METQTVSLSVHPQILDLMEALEQNDLTKQKEDVQSLVGYIENMESSLSVMMSEMQEMHAEIIRLHNKGIRAKCTQLVSKSEDKIRQVKVMVSTAKSRLIDAAENAVKTYKEKGKSALIQTVDAMRIPAALCRIKNGFSHAAQSMQQRAKQLDTIREELHEVGSHMKNAGRIMLGRPTKQTKVLESDKGVLAKLRGFLESCSRAFERMECSADNLLSKTQRDKPKNEERPSVRSELMQMKSAKSEKSMTPMQQETVR